jgi:hypothetical protein
MGKRKATVMSCDAPGCNVQRITTAVEPALGYYFPRGQVHETWGGGPLPELYACSPGHLIAAVADAVQKYERGDD